MNQNAPALCGLVLAAGAGTRFGGPKALARSADGTPWIDHAVQVLTDAGCGHVVVALGASAAEAHTLVPPHAEVVVVEDWAEGLSATLRRGLRAAAAGRTDAVLVVPVDTPGMPVSAVRRVVEAAGEPVGGGAGAGGVPRCAGSSRAHRRWSRRAPGGTLSGDRGARATSSPTERSRWSAPTCGRAPTSTPPDPRRSPVPDRLRSPSIAPTGPRACRGVERLTLRHAQRPNGHRPGLSR